MGESKSPTIKVSDILDCDPCIGFLKKASDYLGFLQKSDEINVVDLLEWGLYTNWLITEKLINLSHQDEVIAYAKASAIRHFAQIVKGADIPKLQNAIIDSADASEFVFFARFVKGADITKLEDAIIALNNPSQIRHFAACVKTANIAKLQDAIIAIGDIYEMKMFLAQVKGANKDKLNKAIEAFAT